MVRFFLRVLGAGLAVVALLEAHSAMWFRLEGSGELREIERLDFVLGGVSALAFGLLFAPSRFKAPWLWLVTLTGAAVIWVGASGSLLWRHREQHRLRSAPSLPQAAGPQFGASLARFAVHQNRKNRCTLPGALVASEG
jgi:hypothetical protein